MMRKARLAIRKVNVRWAAQAILGAGRSLICSLSDASCTSNRFRRFSFCLLEENDKAVA